MSRRWISRGAPVPRQPRLGHEQISTTNIYLHADMTLKENAIAKVTPPSVAATGRYQPTDAVLAFLNAL